MESIDKVILNEMIHVLSSLRTNKPGRDATVARQWAITITELEKGVAYYKMFVVDYEENAHG